MAVVIILAGLIFFVGSGIYILDGTPTLNWAVPLAIGLVLFVVGLVLFITDLLESWLSKGQRALVDGLQAG